MEYTEKNGKEYLRMRAAEAPIKLGISRITFYEDQKKAGWESEEGFKNNIYYLVPRDYAEYRIREKAEKEKKLQQKISQTPKQEEEPPTASESSLSIIEGAFLRVLEEKDKRIALLEEALAREKQLNKALVESKESEIATLKTTMILTNKPNTLEYAPIKKKTGLLSLLKIFEK